MKKLHHKESDLQIRCVKWFRVNYPEFARLMEHPKNEGTGDRKRGAIAKAEGVQAGVADIILHVASFISIIDGEPQEEPWLCHSLAIELKTKTGSQSADQKVFQRYFEAAGNKYVVVRSFEQFVAVVTSYMNGVPSTTLQAMKDLYDQIEGEQLAAARKELDRIINKTEE